MNRPLDIVVVDDEPLAAERLAGFLADMPDCRVQALAVNAAQAFQIAQTQTPELMLLDIAMPGESGLDLAKRLQQLPNPPLVVFCTAFDQHAVAAFEAQAVDYLLKPVRRERLRESIERVIRLKRTSAADDGRDFVAASFGGIIRRIALADIHYLHADDKYTIVHHRGGEHVLDQSLKDLEQQHPMRLLRIHRNCLVNRAQLAELRRDGDGRIWAHLKDSPTPLEVSRRCAGELKDWFKGN
jgi:two-component system response regulator AlgR